MNSYVLERLSVTQTVTAPAPVEGLSLPQGGWKHV
jgi:hypothetical protein